MPYMPIAPTVPTVLGMTHACGHKLLGAELVEATTYREDDDALIVTCPRPGCRFSGPARGSQEMLAELYRRVAARMHQDVVEQTDLLILASEARAGFPDRHLRLRENDARAFAREAAKVNAVARRLVPVVDARPMGPCIEAGVRKAEQLADVMLARADDRAELRETLDTLEDFKQAPLSLKIELWWMRLRLRWAGRDGVRLYVYVPNTVTTPGRTWPGEMF